MKKTIRKITSLVLTTAITLSSFSFLTASKNVVSAVNRPGNAPYINTWLLAGPTDDPVAEQIYSGTTGPVRPDNGNWALVSKAKASSQYQRGANSFPKKTDQPDANYAPEKTIDGNKATQWVAQMHANSSSDPNQWPNWDPSPTVTLSWKAPIKVKTVNFYDRYDKGWPSPDFIDIGEAKVTLKDSMGNILATQTVTDIDPKGAKPGVATFENAVTGVSSVEVLIVYDGTKNNKNLSLGLTEIEVFDGDPIGGDTETPIDPADAVKLDIASVAGGSTYQQNVATNAIDGNPATAWMSNTVQGQVWDSTDFTINLSDISTITGLKINAYENSGTLVYRVKYEMFDKDSIPVALGKTADVTGAIDSEITQAIANAKNVKTIKLTLDAYNGASDLNDRFGYREIEVMGIKGEISEPIAPVTAEITPKLGDKFGTGANETSWEYFDDRIYNRNTDDYNDLFGYLETKQGLNTMEKYAYASTYVYSPKEQPVQLRFVTTGNHKAYVNDMLVDSSDVISNTNDKDTFRKNITLKQGWNKIILQVFHNKAKPYMGFYARIGDSSGNIVDGLTYSVSGPTASALEITTQGLNIDKVAFQERNKDIMANQFPENELPKGYTQWPYVWNKSLTGAWYGPQASKFGFNAAGGSPSYSWEIVAGALPDGLTLGTDGTIDGKCTTAGTFEFTVQVTDAEGTKAVKATKIVVDERPNKWFEEGRVSALSHCAASINAYWDENYSVDLWAERAKEQGVAMLSVECVQGPYWWPAPNADPMRHAPEVRETVIGEDGKEKVQIKDMIKPFHDAAVKYGMRFGVYYGSGAGWQFPHDGALDMLDIEDLIKRYDPSYIFFDGGPQGFDNVEIRWSSVRSYNDYILIQANDQKEASDNDINILEQRYYLDTPATYGGYWEQNMLPQNKYTVLEEWNGPYVNYFHGENAQTGLDWRLLVKDFVSSFGQGFVKNWDQEPSAIRGNREWYYNYAPNIPDIYNINQMFNQDMITIRNQLIDWYKDSGKLDKRESMFGTMPYLFDYVVKPGWRTDPNLAIKYGEGPDWGYVLKRDNNFYMHMVQIQPSYNELIGAPGNMRTKSGFTGQDSMEAGPFDYEVTSVKWFNEDIALPFTTFEKNGNHYANIDTSSVTIDPVDTIIKINTADPAREYKMTSVKTFSDRVDSKNIKLRTEAYMNNFASVFAPATVSFTSTNGTVASVSSDGMVTAKSEGTATINVTALYDGVTKTDVYPVTVDKDLNITPTLDLCGVVMFTGENEVQGKYTTEQTADVTFQGRLNRGGGVDLSLLKPEDITYHYASVDDHSYTTEIPADESLVKVENGVMSFTGRVQEKTNLAYWADVKVGDKTYTTNKMFIWLYPSNNLNKDIVPVASSGTGEKYTTDGIISSKDGANKEKWTTNEKNSSLTYDLGVVGKIDRVEVYYNSEQWCIANAPKDIKIEVSNDNSNWTTVLNPTNVPNNKTAHYQFNDFVTYSVNGVGRYIKVSFPGGAQDKQIDLLEVKIMGLDYTNSLASMEVKPVISADKKTATVDVKGFTGIGNPCDMTGATVKVTSLNEDIATVDSSNVITAVKQGKARINVEVTKGYDTLKSYFYITVDENGELRNDKFLTNVELSFDNTAIRLNAPITAKITGMLNTKENANLSKANIEYVISDDRLELIPGSDTIALKEQVAAGFKATAKVIVTLDGITVESLEIPLTVVGNNLMATTTATASSYYTASGDYKPSQAIDGSKATAWACHQQTNGGNVAPWIKLDFGGTFEFNKLNLVDRGHDVNEIGEALLEWEGGSKLLTGIKWSGQPDNFFTFDTPIKSSWIKLTIDPDSKFIKAGGARGFAEIQLYEVEQPVVKKVVSYKAVSVDTTAGIIPTLPATVEAIYNDGKTGMVDVAWNAITSEMVANAGFFAVEGTVAGTDVKATANVTVNGVVIDADKTDLEALVAYAKEQQADPEYKYVVPAVRVAFENAILQAEALIASDVATQAEVDTAYTELLSKVWMLEYKGNNEKLAKLVAQVQAIKNLDQYTPATVAVLQDRLAKAVTAIEDGNILQDELDILFDDLQLALFDLRLIPNKDKLQELINQANALDVTGYTASSVKARAEAITYAQTVMADKMATQEEVNAAITGIKRTTANLVLIEDEKTDDKETTDTTKDETTDKIDDTKVPTTTDATPIAFAFTLALIGCAVVVYARKVRK